MNKEELMSKDHIIQIILGIGLTFSLLTIFLLFGYVI